MGNTATVPTASSQAKRDEEVLALKSLIRTAFIDTATMQREASEPEPSEQTKQSGPEKGVPAPDLNLQDIENYQTKYDIITMLEDHPQHSVRACKRALELSDSNRFEAKRLLDCKNLMPTPNTIPEPGRDSSPDEETSAVKPFTLMKLPLEVRLMVYKEYLTLPGVIETKGYTYWRGKRRIRVHRDCEHQPPHSAYEPLDPSVFGLFAASKTIYNESLSIFFNQNSFLFDNLNLLLNFLSSLTVDSRRGIGSISFRYSGAAPAKTMKLLKECVGLRRLSIELIQDTLSHVPFSKSFEYQLLKLHGLGDLLKIRGIEELEITVAGPSFQDSAELRDAIPAFRETLQVLKQPHPTAQLKRQEKKDYPQTLGRTVFGKANVITRMEKKIMGTQTA